MLKPWLLGLSIPLSLLSGCGVSQASTFKPVSVHNEGQSSIVSTSAGITVVPSSSVSSQAESMISKAPKGTDVDVEMYEFTDPSLVHALVQAKSHGANVRVLLDATYNGNAETYSSLQSQGVPVKYVHVTSDGYTDIDHVKLLIVGNNVLAGSVNWGTGSQYTTDYDLFVPNAAASVSGVFNYDWNHTNPYVRESSSSGVFLTGDAIEPAILNAISQAKISVDIYMFSFDDKSLEKALIQAKHRGVDVQVWLDSHYERQLNSSAYNTLSQAGIHVTYMPSSSVLHAKTAIIDGRTVIAGSANWTNSGMRYNHELDMEFTSSSVVNQIEKAIG